MFCTNPECPDVAGSGSTGEYRVDMTHCPHCGAVLSAAPSRTEFDATAQRVPDDESGFLVVARLDSAPALDVARSMLDEAGIRHFVRNQQSFSPWGGPGGAGVLGQAELAVEPGRADEAEQLLAQLQQADPRLDDTPTEGEPDSGASVPDLPRALFFGVASALCLAAASIELLQSKPVNGFWLFLGLMMGVFALTARRRRRPAKRDE